MAPKLFIFTFSHHKHQQMPKGRDRYLKEYIVQPGDTLYSIARLFDMTTGRLRALNPEVAETDMIDVGQILRIPQAAAVRPTIEINGYIYPIYDPSQWSTIFPYLTYLSIFGHELRSGGMLTLSENEPLILAARTAGVAPLLVVTNAIEGVYSGELLHEILSNPQAQQALISNIISIAQTYGYYGVNFGFEYIFPEDYASYAVFLESAANQLHSFGLIIVASIRLVVVLEEPAVLPASLSLYSRILDRLILTPGGLICADVVNPIDAVQQGLDYITQYISGPKILIGMPACCYQWQVPYPQDGQYRVLSADEADAIIRDAVASPEIDPQTQMPFFRIMEDGRVTHVLMCESACSLMIMTLVGLYNLGGISFRPLNIFNPGKYQVININNDIRRALPRDESSDGFNL